MKRTSLLLTTVAAPLVFMIAYGGMQLSSLAAAQSDPVRVWWSQARPAAERVEAMNNFAWNTEQEGITLILIELTDAWLSYSEIRPSDELAFRLYLDGHEYMHYTIWMFNALVREQDSRDTANNTYRRYLAGLDEHGLAMLLIAAQFNYAVLPEYLVTGNLVPG